MPRRSSAADRELDLSQSGGEPEPDPRALAAHRRARGAARPSRDDLERAARGRRVRPGRGAAGGRQADALRGVAAGPAVSEDVARYYAAAGDDPRETLAARAALLEAEGRGARDRSRPRLVAPGSDTLELLRRGWRVVAVDAEAAAIGSCSRIRDARLSRGRYSRRVVGRFDEADWPEALTSSRRASRCRSARHRRSRASGRGSAPRSGPAAASAASSSASTTTGRPRSDMTFHTRAEVEALLDGLEVERLDEVDEDGRDGRRRAEALAPLPRRRARSHERLAGPRGRVRGRAARLRGGRLRRPGAPHRRRAGWTTRDRALARQLAFGTVQRVRTLDHAIETLGKRPVRKLDPPVLAALRLGAYQLGYLDGVPRYAAVNESVELVRRARLERAVPFTNAVLRRVGDGIERAARGAARGAAQALLPGLDLGRLAARPRRGGCAGADARAERAATRRGQTCPGTVPGRGRNGHSGRVRGRRAWTRKPWKGARSGRRAAARSSPGSVVGSQPGERVLDLCAAPGGKATMLAGEVVAVEVNEARARELEENVAPARRDERPRRPRGRPRAAGRADRLRPRARRRALLGPRRARGAARPALALAAAARAPARAAARRRRAGPAGRHDRLLRLHDQRGRIGGGRRRVRARGRADRGLGAVPSPDAARVPADAAARSPHERLLHRPPASPERAAAADWSTTIWTRQ